MFNDVGQYILDVLGFERPPVFPSISVGESFKPKRRDFLLGSTTFIAASAAGIDGSKLLASTELDCDKVQIHISYELKRIEVLERCSGQALYSYFKILWKESSEAVRHPFPMLAITAVHFEMHDSWRIINPEMLNFDVGFMDRGLENNGPAT